MSDVVHEEGRSAKPVVADAEPEDGVLDALDDLISVLTGIAKTAELIAERAQHIRSRRADHEPYSVIVPAEGRPLIVEQARASLNERVEVSGRLQRAEARALYHEGLSMERIGALFGVSRQRVSDFLQ